VELVRNTWERLKLRVARLRLSWDIRSLERALDGECEALGLAALRLKPTGLEAEDLFEELASIQSLTNERRDTLDSLRGTKGAGPVVRDLKDEVHALNQRQRRLIIDVGRRALEARLELEGLEARYSAMERIVGALDGKRVARGRIEEELGVTGEPGRLESVWARLDRFFRRFWRHLHR
jgi:hypothetical protein